MLHLQGHIRNNPRRCRSGAGAPRKPGRRRPRAWAAALSGMWLRLCLAGRARGSATRSWRRRQFRRRWRAYSEQGNKLVLPFFRVCSLSSKPKGECIEAALDHDRRSAGARERDGRTLDRRLPAPHPRRNFVEARSGEYRAGRRSLPHRHRRRASSRRREASSCARRCRWRSFINRPTAPPTPTPCSRPRSKVFRRRRNFRRSREAQTLLAALAETDEVKNAAASRQRRLKLQTSYGQAMMWSRGFAAEETKAAFARARELAAGVDNAAERFDTYYGLWSVADCAAS